MRYRMNLLKGTLRCRSFLRIFFFPLLPDVSQDIFNKTSFKGLQQRKRDYEGSSEDSSSCQMSHSLIFTLVLQPQRVSVAFRNVFVCLNLRMTAKYWAYRAYRPHRCRLISNTVFVSIQIQEYLLQCILRCELIKVDNSFYPICCESI